MSKRIPLSEQNEKNVVFSKSSNGQFVKRVKGHVYCFGTDEKAARKLWKLHKDSLIAGRGWKITSVAGNGIDDAVNHFLKSKKRELDEREIVQITFDNLVRKWKQHVKVLGAGIDVGTLNPQDFDKLRNHWKKLGYRLTTVRTRTREVIEFVRHCIRHEFIVGKTEFDIFGDSFKIPKSEAILREADELPESDILFTAKEIKLLIDSCNEAYRLMVLLGINCGFKFSDSSRLKFRHINLENKLIKYRRPKNQMPRVAPLWDETIEAYEKYLNVRPKAFGEANKDFVLITHSGTTVYKPQGSNSAPRYFRRRMEDLGIFKEGRGISHLRHTFRTVADECTDLKAIRTVMGHSGGIEDAYAKAEYVAEKRLRAVTDIVHDWLYGNESNEEEVQPGVKNENE